ncbi:MAG TPA: hypothetical protein VLT33_07640, partial [Labilithrix sp.]|nr:hypothetical protein [Labilithrix sp.]
MNGSNGYPPGGYGAPPPQQGYAGQSSQQPYTAPSPYGAAPQQQPYGAPPQQQYGAPPAYGAPPGYGAPAPYGAAPPPYGQVQYPGQAMGGMPGMGGMVSPKNPGLAVALELLGGFFLQTFGVGHLYAGNVGLGLGLMFGYWVLMAINILLCAVLIGFVTWPLTWLAFMIISAITANNAAKAANARAGLA